MLHLLLRVLLLAGLVAFAVGESTGGGRAQSPPHQFFGDGNAGSGATIDGVPAPDGTTITVATEEGEELAVTAVRDGGWLIEIDAGAANFVTFGVFGCETRSEPFPVVAGDLTEVRLDVSGCDGPEPAPPVSQASEPIVEQADEEATALAGEDQAVERVADEAEEAVEQAAEEATVRPESSSVTRGEDEGDIPVWVWVVVGVAAVASAGIAAGLIARARRPRRGR